MRLSYQFEVQQGDIVYVGYCQRRDYKAEWRVGNDVQFRLRKDKMCLKTPQRKGVHSELLVAGEARAQREAGYDS